MWILIVLLVITGLISLDGHQRSKLFLCVRESAPSDVLLLQEVERKQKRTKHVLSI